MTYAKAVAISPLAVLRATMASTSYLSGWETSEAVPGGLLHADGATIEPEAKSSGRWVWVASSADFEEQEFHHSDLKAAMDWAARA